MPKLVNRCRQLAKLRAPQVVLAAAAAAAYSANLAAMRWINCAVL